MGIQGIVFFALLLMVTSPKPQPKAVKDADREEQSARNQEAP